MSVPKSNLEQMQTGTYLADLGFFAQSMKLQNNAPKALVIQNHSQVGLGSLEEVLKHKGFSITSYNGQDVDFSKVSHEDFDLMVVLGGTTGAYEDDKNPWLEPLRQLIKSRMSQDLPLIGSCLGGQLIAQVLGAKVYASPLQKEVGYFPLKLTDAGEKHLISCFTVDGVCVPESHGDVFELPNDVTLLASTERNPNQVFKKGNTLAFQFHPEAIASSFSQWVQLWADLAKKTGESFDSERPLREMNTYAERFEKVASSFFNDWIDKCVITKEVSATATLNM
jgi:GMP synthase (glutamine-hydrolysing)